MYLEKILHKVDQQVGAAFFYTPPIYKNATSYLFSNPAEYLFVDKLSDVKSGFNKLDQLINDGYTGYGKVNYESGYAFEDRLSKIMDPSVSYPFLDFVFFHKSDVIKIDSDSLLFDNVNNLLKNGHSKISEFKIETDKEKYLSDINKIKNYIKEGDTYQVNYTVKSTFKVEGDLQNLFLNLIFNQSARYSAYINGKDKVTISISPELFFKTNDTIINTSPMKGTQKRGKNLSDDKLKQILLNDSLKDMAENIMIVDLLRNDLGRICNTDSVTTENIYKIEKYESVYQMVSSVHGQLKNQTLSNIFENIFPCGSITGAPKISTMKIIKELEQRNRNLYTGAIGIVKKNEYIFNVPIRTLEIDKQSNSGELGIGSGVVWDSDPESEYEETVLKAKFLTDKNSYFEIFETMLIENGKIYLPELHLNRITSAADYFLFGFDEAKYSMLIEKILDQVEFNKNYKLKVTLDKWGRLNYNIDEIEKYQSSVDVVISESQINSSNKFQYFKTTNRGIYDSADSIINDGKYFDVLYLNENGNLAEGSRTNLFYKLSGRWYTPPISSGILDGCYRKIFMEKFSCIERALPLMELESVEELILTNSVRKEVKVLNIFRGIENIKSFQ